MFCCWSLPKLEDSERIVDITEILKEKAWYGFHHPNGLLKRMMLKRQNYDFEVPENYFHFEVLDQIITPLEHKNPTINIGSDNANEEIASSSLLGGHSSGSASVIRNPAVVSLDTEFHNDTAKQQQYKFRCGRTRRTETEVTLKQGITLNGKATVSIGASFGNIGVEAGMQYEVTKSSSQKFEDSVVMEATSDIDVGPKSCNTVKVQLEERVLHSMFYFKIVLRMSMPQGYVPVYIKRKSDGHSVSVLYVRNFSDIFNNSVPYFTKIVKAEKSGEEKSGAEESGAEKSGTEISGAEKSGAEKSGAEKSGAKESGAEESGAETSGAEKSGEEKSKAKKSGTKPEEKLEFSTEGVVKGLSIHTIFRFS